jgi:hypothetical protein
MRTATSSFSRRAENAASNRVFFSWDRFEPSPLVNRGASEFPQEVSLLPQSHSPIGS